MQYYKSTKKQNKKCLYNDCSQLAINSHLLQKNGIIDKISENNHVYQFEFNPYQRSVIFKKTGKGEPCTFKMFCAKHDDSLFKEVEMSSLDCNDYKTQLLVSYRGMLSELRKLMDHVITFDKELKNRLLISVFGENELKEKKGKFEASIDELLFYKHEFEDALSSPDLKPFIFHTFFLPDLQICTSTIYCDYAGKFKLVGEHRGRENKILNSIPVGFPPNVFINLIPQLKSTVMIIGFHSADVDDLSDLVKSYQYMETQDLIKAVSDILIKSIETWYCSPSFYEHNIRPNQNTIIDLIVECLGGFEGIEHKEKEIAFNIFGNNKST